MNGADYSFAGESEGMRQAREVAAEINDAVMAEDKHVCQLHFQATASKAWKQGLLGDSERALREHHDMLRQLIPELTKNQI